MSNHDRDFSPKDTDCQEVGYCSFTPDDLKEESDQLPVERQEIAYNDLTRREVRSLIFHLLYAMEGYDYTISLESLVDNFNRGYDLDIPLDSEVFSISQEIIQRRDELDGLIKPPLINWRFERIGVVTKLILRFALWELDFTDTAPNIIINEAVELAKCFAEKDAFKFINGILDEAVKARTEDD